MVWFYVLLVILTYPVVFVGSFLLGLLIIMISDGGPSTPNPFVSPARVYSAYRTTLEIWYVELVAWYRRESKR